MKYTMEGWYRDGEICHSECASALQAYNAMFGLMQSGRLARVIATGEDGHKLFDAFFPPDDGMQQLYSMSPDLIAEVTAKATEVAARERKASERLGMAILENEMAKVPAANQPPE